MQTFETNDGKEAVANLNLESRFRLLAKTKPEEARQYRTRAQLDVETRWRFYQHLAAQPVAAEGQPPPDPPPAPAAATEPKEKP